MRGLYVRVTHIFSTDLVLLVSSDFSSPLPCCGQEHNSVLFLKLHDRDRPSYLILKLPSLEWEFFLSVRPLKLKNKIKQILQRVINSK